VVLLLLLLLLDLGRLGLVAIRILVGRRGVCGLLGLVVSVLG
jgi:hypothetical protein